MEEGLHGFVMLLLYHCCLSRGIETEIRAFGLVVLVCASSILPGGRTALGPIWTSVFGLYLDLLTASMSVRLLFV